MIPDRHPRVLQFWLARSFVINRGGPEGSPSDRPRACSYKGAYE